MTQLARVLIIDDRRVVRQTIKNTLLGLKCAYSEAGDGTTALTLMREQEFEVIFLDLRLPDLSGIEILQRARQFEKVVGRVIVMTGFPDAETRTAAKQLGAFEYLTKDPLDWHQVRDAFARATSSSVATQNRPPIKDVFGR